MNHHVKNLTSNEREHSNKTRTCDLNSDIKIAQVRGASGSQVNKQCVLIHSILFYILFISLLFYYSLVLLTENNIKN